MGIVIRFANDNDNDVDTNDCKQKLSVKIQKMKLPKRIAKVNNNNNYYGSSSSKSNTTTNRQPASWSRRH